MKASPRCSTLIREQLDRLEIGTARTFGGLTVFPLLADGAGIDADPGYLTLDRALAGETIRISEVSDSGRVPELRLENLGDQPVLLLDGEELSGAKQNRVLNLTILAPANTTITIPVSCVEAGRWSSMGRHFSSLDHVMPSLGRSEKLAQVSRSMASGGHYSSDQLEVWDRVRRTSEMYKVKSDTSRLADVYQAKRREMDDFVKALEPVERQVGVAFVTNGRVGGVELFDRHRTLRDLHGKLVKSWAMDAMAAGDTAQEVPAPGQVRVFLEEIAEACDSASEQRALGIGSDVRISGKRIVGSALAHDERVLHLCAFRTEQQDVRPDDSASDSTSDGGSRRGPVARLASRIVSASRRRGRYEQ